MYPPKSPSPPVRAAEAPSQPGPIQQAQALVGGLLSSALRRVRAARKVIWHVEDLAVGGAKLALHVARRSVRPLLVGLIVHRALRTIEGSRLPAMRMARMSPAERLEYHNTRLMGADWREQMEQDFLDAAKEVQDGYITGGCCCRMDIVLFENILCNSHIHPIYNVNLHVYNACQLFSM